MLLIVPPFQDPLEREGEREWTMRYTAVILFSCWTYGHRRLFITEKETDGMESVPEQNRLRSFDILLVVRDESHL